MLSNHIHVSPFSLFCNWVPYPINQSTCNQSILQKKKFLFTNLISQGIISIIYKFNLFFIARKISLHFTTRRNSQIILFRIIWNVTETWNYLTSLSFSFILCLLQVRSFRLLCTILNISFISILLLQFTQFIPFKTFL